jgi:CcmD family protein
MKAIATTLLCCWSIALAAQAPHWLEDRLYGGGKMNAVAAVVAAIFIGIGWWMWSQDRRLKRLERRIEEQAGKDRG